MPLKFNLKKCTGCKLCQLACSAVHDCVFNPEKARLKLTHEYNSEGIRIRSSSCIHCGKCAKVCPCDAISDNGRWMEVNEDICDGCGICVENCPTNIIYLDTTEKSTICDLCNGDPECIKWCPKNVITLREKGVTK